MSRHLSSVLRGGFALVVVAGLVVSACGDRPPPEGVVAVPCGGDEASVLELGPAGKLGGRYGQFSTTGGTVWVTVTDLPRGGLFDPDRTGIDVGWADRRFESLDPHGHDRRRFKNPIGLSHLGWNLGRRGLRPRCQITASRRQVIEQVKAW